MTQPLSAEAAVLHAALERDYVKVAELLRKEETWSLDEIWLFYRRCQELTSFLHSFYMQLREERV